jgi:gp16 family phage-associated protein
MATTTIKTLQQVKDEFDEGGISVREWAKSENLPYDAVMDVLGGRRAGRRGFAHDAAVALKIKNGRRRASN